MKTKLFIHQLTTKSTVGSEKTKRAVNEKTYIFFLFLLITKKDSE